MLYRQSIITLIVDSTSPISGTGIITSNIVTESKEPSEQELRTYDNVSLRAYGKGSPVIRKRILFSYMEEGRVRDYRLEDVYTILRLSSVRRLRNTGKSFPWYDCSPETVEMAVRSVINGEKPSSLGEKLSEKKNTVSRGRTASSRTHNAADALDWGEAMKLINQLYEDGRFRDSMLIACGCFLGLRISDLLLLKWKDILSDEELSLNEKKTGKTRKMRVNPALKEHATKCFEELGYARTSDLIFCGYMNAGSKPMSRQRAAQILAECKHSYHIRSAKVFSTHSLRKTFGRRVWLRECDMGKGDQALLLLQNVFGHSSIDITKRYLGIRQEEILSVYDNLM